VRPVRPKTPWSARRHTARVGPGVAAGPGVAVVTGSLSVPEALSVAVSVSVAAGEGARDDEDGDDRRDETARGVPVDALGGAWTLTRWFGRTLHVFIRDGRRQILRGIE